MTEFELFETAEAHLFSAVREATHRVQLVSPFLSMRVATELARFASKSSAEWSLLTHLDPLAVAGRYLSIDGLRALRSAGVRVGHLDRLHAKVYVADQIAIVGSANLTGTGLGNAARSNVELSVALPSEAVTEIRTQINSWWNSAAEVGEVDLKELESRARALPRIVSAPATLEPEPSEAVSVAVAELIADARERSLWVKAQYGDPEADQWRAAHWFSSSKRGRPSFAQGDLILIYSKAAHATYAIVEVMDSPVNDPGFVIAAGYPEEDGERWPWVTTTQPRLVPNDGAVALPQDLGFTPQGLQGGHRRIGLSEFVTAVHILGGGTTH